jgi:signal peptidase I
MATKKIIKIIVEWVIYAVIFVAIVFGTPKALAKALNTSYPIASITSSSMWPVLKSSDLVFIKGVKGKNEINLGEIVVYRNDRGFTIHRVVKLDNDTFTTKGDANNVEDPPVKYEELIGKTVNLKGKPIRIPYLGMLSQVFNKRN